MIIYELEASTNCKYFYNVRDQLKDFVYQRSMEAFSAGDAVRDSIKSPESLELYKDNMRKRFIEAIGGLPSMDTPLNPQILGEIKSEGYRVEKVVFESRPKAYVTANLYIPEGIEFPSGAVLFLPGHMLQAKHAHRYQSVCLQMVKAGLVVMAIDPLGQGERLYFHGYPLDSEDICWGTGEHNYTGIQCWFLGDSIARYFVHDAMRAVDYLCTRPEVDPVRIGVTGSSGGGTQTCLMMICDPRIAAAAPATFLTNRQSYLFSGQAQDAEQIWPGTTAMGFDHEDILVMMAPRPTLVLAAGYDFFPIEGTRRSVERTRRFWEMYGSVDNLQLFEEEVEHCYTDNMAEAAACFFAEHLQNRRAPFKAMPKKDAKPLEPSLLWCTKSGQTGSEWKDCRFVPDENSLRLAELKESARKIQHEQRKAAALLWLRERVFYRRKICDFNIRHIGNYKANGLTILESLWWSQTGLFNHAYTFRNQDQCDACLPVTLAIWEGGTSSVQQHINWIRKTCSQGRAVMLLDVIGVGALEPNPVNPYPRECFDGVIAKLCDDLIWLDDSIAAMRIFDVLRAIDAVKLFPGIMREDMTLYSYGRYALYAQVAALLSYDVKKIVLEDVAESLSELATARHYDPSDVMSIVLPGILKYLDSEELSNWLRDKS